MKYILLISLLFCALTAALAGDAPLTPVQYNQCVKECYIAFSFDDDAQECIRDVCGPEPLQSEVLMVESLAYIDSSERPTELSFVEDSSVDEGYASTDDSITMQQYYSCVEGCQRLFRLPMNLKTCSLRCDQIINEPTVSGGMLTAVDSDEIEWDIIEDTPSPLQSALCVTQCIRIYRWDSEERIKCQASCRQ